MRNTAESGRALLGALSDDELARYGEIARDQADLELHRWWWQAVLALAALGALTWGAHKLISASAADPWRYAGIAVGLALVLGYWPYRRLKNWSLWQCHVKAVAAERERRLGIAD